MSVMEEVRNLYAKYLEEALSAEKKQKLTDGMFGFGKKEIVFNRNTTAVNAWNVNNFSDLEENLSNSSYCGNDSVFTADLQPVRDEF